jgi:hypothetical protein
MVLNIASLTGEQGTRAAPSTHRPRPRSFSWSESLNIELAEFGSSCARLAGLSATRIFTKIDRGDSTPTPTGRHRPLLRPQLLQRDRTDGDR